MSKYIFRLAALQRVREARRDERRSALADAFRAEEVLVEQQFLLTAEEQDLRSLQRSAVAGEYLDVNRLLEAQRYGLLLKARGQELAKQTALLDAEIENRRQALVDADREVRVLARLDERHRRVHRRNEDRKEMKRLDETASIAANRSRRI